MPLGIGKRRGEDPQHAGAALGIVARSFATAALMLGTAAGLTVVAAVSAWWPARRGARMNIVDALRHDLEVNRVRVRSVLTCDAEQGICESHAGLLAALAEVPA